MAQTPIWQLEVHALDSTGEMTATSLAGYLAAVKAVADVIPDAGAMTDIAADAATAAGGVADITSIKAVTDVIPNAGALTDLVADVTDIKAVTDVIPDAGALTALIAEADKIDQAVTDGLLGTNNSLSYRVHELEKHFHNRARRWGATGAPDETNAIDANVNRPFVAISGDNAWGVAIPIIGTADVPVPSDAAVKYDLHHVLISDVDDATAYQIRIIYGTGTSGDAIAAEQWTEFMFFAGTGPKSSGAAIEVMMPRVDVGTKCWCQVWCFTNLSEVSFYIGVHGYQG